MLTATPYLGLGSSLHTIWLLSRLMHRKHNKAGGTSPNTHLNLCTYSSLCVTQFCTENQISGSTQVNQQQSSSPYAPGTRKVK